MKKQTEIDWHNCDYCGGYGIEREDSGGSLLIGSQSCTDLIIQVDGIIDVEICFSCIVKILTHVLGKSNVY